MGLIKINDFSRQITSILNLLSIILIVIITQQFHEPVTANIFLASLAFLTVLVIFVPFLAKKDLQKLKDLYIEVVWVNYKKKFEDSVSFILAEMKKRKSEINFEEVEKKISTLEDTISELSFHRKSKEIDKFFNFAFIGYLVSIMIGIFLVPPTELVNYGLYSTGIMTYSFLFATINLVKIFVNWFDLQKLERG